MRIEVEYWYLANKWHGEVSNLPITQPRSAYTLPDVTRQITEDIENYFTQISRTIEKKETPA